MPPGEKVNNGFNHKIEHHRAGKINQLVLYLSAYGLHHLWNLTALKQVRYKTVHWYKIFQRKEQY